METTRYAPADGARPASLALSAAVMALAVAGIIFAGPQITDQINLNGPLIVYTVPTPPDPAPPPKPEPQQRDPLKTAPRHEARPDQPKVEVWTPPTGPSLTQGDPVTVDAPPGTGSGVGTGTGTVIEPPVPPVLIEPVVDPRYARDFQPLYPGDERRLGHEGLVIVNVLIGTDGRVKQIDKISAASDAFFETTRRQALSKWRFRAATRGGEPIERWRRMRVNFVLTEE
ncbi:MAG: energy transducer TonB [Sphingomonas sp.]|uniref:energy transducer TonB n=1 Tax=Sphingomonas sp. TaxID=28214 RepID=UPI0025D12359|nr:energy transducer TonB [Sphingomonas sp.]MBY0283204.1 energy transducer TonB [Sphingomonas sp.]